MKRGEAKRAITRHFNDRHGETIYPSDLAELFGLSHSTILKLVRELERDGVIRKAK